jgi:hypothetical protein
MTLFHAACSAIAGQLRVAAPRDTRGMSASLRSRHPQRFFPLRRDRLRVPPSAPSRAQRPDSVAHIGLELANVAFTRRDLHRSFPGVREKSLVRKCSVNPRSSPEITKNRHFPSSSPICPATQSVSASDPVEGRNACLSTSLHSTSPSIEFNDWCFRAAYKRIRLPLPQTSCAGINDRSQPPRRVLE